MSSRFIGWFLLRSSVSRGLRHACPGQSHEVTPSSASARAAMRLLAPLAAALALGLAATAPARGQGEPPCTPGSAAQPVFGSGDYPDARARRCSPPTR